MSIHAHESLTCQQMWKSLSSLCFHVIITNVNCMCAERRHDCDKGGDCGENEEDPSHHQKERGVNGERSGRHGGISFYVTQLCAHARVCV